MFSTLALGKERELVKEETALKARRKKQYAFMYMEMYMYKLYMDAYVYTGSRDGQGCPVAP